MFTINSAYLGFEEETKGSIRPGKRADLAIISGGDLYNTPADKIKDLTVVGGLFIRVILSGKIRLCLGKK